MSTDNELHCNNLRCRKVVTSEPKAVVTNCSHIFCVECAHALFSSSRKCPACETQLTENDDIVYSVMNPSTDYKSSVLAGLSPSIILEIATRAMSFWTYQTSQEAAFQSMVLKTARERCLALEREMKNAEEEMLAAREKINNQSTELENANRKIHELVQTQRAKDAENIKLKGYLDVMKRKQGLVGAERIAGEVLYQGMQQRDKHGSDVGYGGDGRDIHRVPSVISTSSHLPQTFMPHGNDQHQHQQSPRIPPEPLVDNRRFSNSNVYTSNGHEYTAGGNRSGGGLPLNNLQNYVNQTPGGGGSGAASRRLATNGNGTPQMMHGHKQADTGMRSVPGQSRKTRPGVPIF